MIVLCYNNNKKKKTLVIKLHNIKFFGTDRIERTEEREERERFDYLRDIVV